MMAADGELPLVRRNGKSEAAFRTISEVADDLDVPQHVLRFWESKFLQVKPLKRGGGRRYYRPEDVTLLKRIRDLLYSEGYTIKGVQKLLREGGGKEAAPNGGAEAGPAFVPDASPPSDEDEASPTEDFVVAASVIPDEDDAADEDDHAPAISRPSHIKPLAPDVRRELTDILGDLEQLRSLLTPR